MEVLFYLLCYRTQGTQKEKVLRSTTKIDNVSNVVAVQ
jgi:hypothetical protein